MKKILIMVLAVMAFGTAAAQTDTISKTRQKTVVTDKTSTILKDDPAKTKKNPDGTRKTTKTYEGTTKPNTNATRNNTTGSPVPVRKPTDTTATPSGTMGPDRTKGGNTTKTPVPNGTSPLPNTGTTTPRK